mmetsp:Transcript_88864/g.240950  ORF Transcript_88864/g.240950 Transcript_88864/m.240950 type:complete len:148 (-) Transcript_88864:117-560(-)
MLSGNFQVPRFVACWRRAPWMLCRFSGFSVHKAAAANDATKIRQFWDPNAKEFRDRRGRTALIYAAANGSLDALRCLVELGADLEARDERRRTALLAAAEAGHVEVVRLLQALGADAAVRDACGRTVTESARCQPAVRAALKERSVE